MIANPNHDKDAVARFMREYLAVMSEPDQVERARKYRLALVRHNPDMRFNLELPPKLEL